MSTHATPSDLTYYHPIPDHLEIAQPFGATPEAYARAGMKGHNGIDFAADEGTGVRAVLPGTVVHAGFGDEGPYSWLLGNSAGIAIFILHTIGEERLITGYAHLDDLYVTTGQAVHGGDLIAASGDTGYTSGPHLHFEALPIGPGGEVDTGNGYLGRIDPTPLTEARD